MKKLTLMSVRGRLCHILTRNLHSQRLKKTICATGLLLSAYALQAQAPALKPLSIGDTVPDITINNIINYKTTSAKLSDFKEKLVILDFMNTYCLSCISVLPRFDFLQREYGHKLQIFIVTNEDKERVEKFLKTNPVAKKISVPVIALDTTLKKIFPHVYISHEAWINNGIVKAITHAEYVTSENIIAALKGVDKHWPVKRDITYYDYSQPLMIANKLEIPDGSVVQTDFYASVSGHMNNVTPRAGSVTDSASQSIRIYMINYSLAGIILHTFGLFADFPVSHMVLNIKDTGKIMYNPMLGYKDTWRQANTYCYEILFPLRVDSAQRLKRIRSDINLLFGIESSLEKRKVKCWILKTSEKDGRTFKTFKNYRIATEENYISIGRLVYNLNRTIYGHPVINETSFSSNNYLPESAFNGYDITSVQKALMPYGLVLEEGAREVLMLVLKDTTNKTITNK